jgi:ribonuclease BN (tRNA processing enzyme)
LLIAGTETILVDTGDGTVDQLAKHGLTLGSVRTVFVSHHHHDHVGGLAAVIGLRWMNQFPGVLTVYGPPGTHELVDGILKQLGPQSRIGFGLGQAPPPPAQSVRVVELDGKTPVRIGDLTITAVPNSHFDVEGKAAAGAALSLSYRFQLGTRSIAYTGDTGPSAAVEALSAGSDMLVSEVIDLDRLLAQIKVTRRDATPEMLADMSKHLGTHHLLAADLGAMAARAKVGRVVLTHFAIPGPLAESERDLRAGIRQYYAGPLDLARDLSSFDLGCP